MIQRSDFLLTEELAFLNHGSFGLCPRELLDVQRAWQERMETQPVLFHRELPRLLREAREQTGAFLGCSPQDLVFVSNSTFGVNVIAHSMRSVLAPGDQILTTDHEYGACIRAWEYHLTGTGVELDVCSLGIPSPDQDELFNIITSAVTDRTRVLFFSHVTSPTAIRLPAERLCAWARERGILTVVDGSHVPAHLPLNLDTLNADAYTGNFHKWMCTPKGSAFLWVAASLQSRIHAPVVSWGGMVFSSGEGAFIDDNEYLGTRDPSPFLTTASAIEWMARNNWAEVQAVARAMRDETMEALLQIPGVGPVSHWSSDQLQMGAVTLPTSVDSQRIKSSLYDDHAIEVVVQPWLTVPIVRFSVHAHTRQSDLKRLIDVLPQFVS